MEPLFGVIAGGTAGSLQTKKKLHLANLTCTQTHQEGNIQFLSTEWHVQNKPKKVLDLSKLTLFGIRDRTVIIMNPLKG